MLPIPEGMSLVEGILSLYREGYFPMAGMGDDPLEVDWVQPQMRCLIPLDERFHVSRTLGAKVRQNRFEITIDRNFAAVIRSCAQPRDGDGNWLSNDIVEAYIELHNAGHAHSVEAWLPCPADVPPDAIVVDHKMLVGGLYGVAIGAIFCGESMFSRPQWGGTDASKVCLIHLVGHLRQCGFKVLDSQIANAHTAQFGAFEISAKEYMKVLAQLRDKNRVWDQNAR